MRLHDDDIRVETMEGAYKILPSTNEPGIWQHRPVETRGDTMRLHDDDMRVEVMKDAYRSPLSAAVED